MARQRLSWDEKKVAELTKTADPYTMNQTRQNPPVEKYQTGDPDAWGETPNMATPWKSEGRTETGHPAPAREAVVGARKLEDKALKCITIAQRMLPGADDSVIEEQATDFMYLPEKSVLATLQRQASLAEKLAGKAEENAPAEGEEAAPAEGEEVEAKKKAPAEGEEAAPEEGKAAAEPAEKTTAKPEKKPDQPAAPAEEAPEEGKAAAEPAEKTTEKPEKKPAAPAPAAEPKEVASSDDLLNQLFQDSETATASESKQGAKKLSGIVKQASSGGDPQLAGLWDAPPDISTAFKY